MPRITLVVPLVCLLSACALPPAQPRATAPPPAETASQLVAAQQDFDDGNMDEAGRRFARILAVKPDHREARLGMAEVQLARGQPREALPLFEGLADDPVARPLALQGRGLALLALGRHAMAEAALGEAVAASPHLWRAWNGLGRLADAAMRWNDSDIAYAKALDASPAAAAVHSNRGYSLLLRGNYGAAETACRTALGLAPRLQVAANNLRLALAWQGRYDEALAGSPPDEAPAALSDIGTIALARGEVQRAESYLHRALSASPRYLPEADRSLAVIRLARASN
jgi:Flp pilus assembly protein TadD